MTALAEPSRKSFAGATNGAVTPTRLRDLMTAGSQIRYAIWRLTGMPRVVKVVLRGGERLLLRPEPAKDLSVAYEVFVDELYRLPPPCVGRSIRRIVDVGANVGYSLVYFSRQFPNARLEAFEPHPDHLKLMAANLAANGLADRVNVYPVAAGLAQNSAWLVDASASSYVTNKNGTGRIPIQVEDFFATLNEGRIDLLKMDCEGGEYELVMSPRFAQLDVSTLILEWHATPDRPEADQTIASRLHTLGWNIQLGASHSLQNMRFGMIWAYR